MSRLGTFSSSSIHKLMSSGRAAGSIGKPFYTYVEEKAFEHRLQRELQKEESAKPLKWGHLLENFAFNELELQYKLISKTRYYHDSIPYWSGMPDCITEDRIVDIKSHWTLKAFCTIVESYRGGLEAFKAKHKDYYWQLLSNAILADKKIVEIVSFVPYKSQLEEIKEFVGSPQFTELKLYSGDYYFLEFAQDNELPYLIEGGYYKNAERFEFEIPQEDKEHLTSRVKLAGVELEKLLG